MTLKQSWSGTRGGSTFFHPNQWKSTRFEVRPDLATPKALLDARIRRAMANTVDKPGMNEALYNGEGLVAESMIPPTAYFASVVDAATSKYAYDPRRSEQIMNQVGWTKGPDGTYTSPSEGRFTVELKTHPGPGNEREVASLASLWRDNGFEVQEVMLAPAQAQDQQLRATFPGLYHNSQSIGEPEVFNMLSSAIPGPENRWIGGNRGGWVNAEYDRLGLALGSILDRQERGQYVAQMMRILTDEVPVISMFFSYQYWAWTSAVTGPGEAAPGAAVAWNIHEWEYR
jgi:peptide/nickel transport system substrate-binding protein